jgi:peptidoglycan/LPS O-acetylase OafA/YrhL
VQGKKNPEIERLRGVAVMMVVAFHLLGFLGHGAAFGWTGVDLFFVISGFVVATSLDGLLPETPPGARFLDRLRMAGPALRRFFLRRVFRILPLAWFWAFTTVLVAIYWPNGEFADPPTMLRELGAILSMTYNYAVIYGGSNWLGPYWSLAVEEHFYLLLPLLFVALTTRARRLAGACVVIAVVAFVLRSIDASPDRFQYHHLASHCRFDSLAVGVALAMLRKLGFGGGVDRALGRLGTPAFVLGLLLLMFSFGFYMPNEFAMRHGALPVALMAGALVFLASLERGFVLSGRVTRGLLAAIGARSYAWYLVHQPAVFFVRGVWRRFGTEGSWLGRDPLEQQALFAVQVLVLAALLAELSYRLIERPFIALGVRVIAGREAQVTAAAAAPGVVANALATEIAQLAVPPPAADQPRS